MAKRRGQLVSATNAKKSRIINNNRGESSDVSNLMGRTARTTVLFEPIFHSILFRFQCVINRMTRTVLIRQLAKHRRQLAKRRMVRHKQYSPAVAKC